MPTRSITKVLDPRLATLSATYKFSPLSTDITATRVVTASITPSRVRKVRSLCDRSVSSAIQKVSCNATSDCLNSDRGFRGLSSTVSIVNGYGHQKFHNFVRIGILKLVWRRILSLGIRYNGLVSDLRVLEF